MTHYHVHHHRPRTRVGKLVRELHMRHHFQDDTKGFGVSAPFWDYVFGTPQRRSGQAVQPPSPCYGARALWLPSDCARLGTRGSECQASDARISISAVVAGGSGGSPYVAA